MGARFKALDELVFMAFFTTQTIPFEHYVPFGQKTGKNSFPVLLYCDSTKAPTDLGRVPTDGS